jgi:hypothetical protein
MLYEDVNWVKFGEEGIEMGTLKDERQKFRVFERCLKSDKAQVVPAREKRVKEERRMIVLASNALKLKNNMRASPNVICKQSARQKLWTCGYIAAW